MSSYYQWFMGGSQPALSAGSGAIDVIAIRNDDGKIASCTPFHVKLQTSTSSSSNKTVSLYVNHHLDSYTAPSRVVSMKLGKAGEAFFVHKIDNDTNTSGNETDISKKKPKAKHRKSEADLKNQVKLKLKIDENVEGPDNLKEIQSDSSPSDGKATEKAIIDETAALEVKNTAAVVAPSWAWSWGSLPTSKNQAIASGTEEMVTVTDSDKLRELGDSRLDASEGSPSALLSPLPLMGNADVDVSTTAVPPLEFPQMDLTVLNDGVLLTSNATEAVSANTTTDLVNSPHIESSEQLLSNSHSRCDNGSNRDCDSVGDLSDSEDSGYFEDDIDICHIPNDAISPEPPVGDFYARRRAGSGHSVGSSGSGTGSGTGTPRSSNVSVHDDDCDSLTSSDSFYSTSNHNAWISDKEKLSNVEHISKKLSMDGRRVGSGLGLGIHGRDGVDSSEEEDDDVGNGRETRSRSGSVESLTSCVSYDSRSNVYSYESDTSGECSTSNLKSNHSSNHVEEVVKPIYHYKKSLVPSAKLLQMMKLVDGQNEVCFQWSDEVAATGAAGGGSGAKPNVQATDKCLLKLYLFVWPSCSCRIVICNIDGCVIGTRKPTGTTSSYSLFGSILLGTVGGSSAATVTAKYEIIEGTAELLNKISENGYRLLYIASKSTSALISKTDFSITIDNKTVKIPHGPIFQSPESLIKVPSGTAFGTAAWSQFESSMYVFKAAALQGVKKLFDTKTNPFYAAFGSTQCDIMAFNRCEIPEGRMYMVKQLSTNGTDATDTHSSANTNTISTNNPNVNNQSISQNSTNTSRQSLNYCMYNVNHVNYKLPILEYVLEHMDTRFPVVTTHTKSCITNGSGNQMGISTNLNSVKPHMDNDYWRLPIPIVD